MKYFLGALLLFSGFLLGWQGLPAWQRLSLSSQQRSLIKQFPQVNWQPCQESGNFVSCAIFTLQQSAYREQNADYCQGLVDSNQRGLCLERVRQLQSLDEELGVFCQGLSDDPVCTDLARTLQASRRDNPALCEGIDNPAQQVVCLGLLTSRLVESPDHLFGPPCNLTDPSCAALTAAFSQAVSQNQSDLCQPTKEFADLCRYEVGLYQAFKADNPNLCELLPDQAQGLPSGWADNCRFDLVVAQALAENNAKVCENLLQAPMIKTCQEVFTRAAGEGRFGYLGLASPTGVL